MKPGLEDILREFRQRLQDLYGDRFARLVLFGSQARGDAALDADIDLLVVLQGAVEPGREILRTGPIAAELSLRHDTVLSCTFVSQDRFATEDTPLLLNVRREGIAV